MDSWYLLKAIVVRILFLLVFHSLGFATVYGYKVSDIDEMLDVRNIIGVCQQLDLYFDVLTVQENLTIAASIKGIPPNYVIQEVSQSSSDDIHVICFI